MNKKTLSLPDILRSCAAAHGFHTPREAREFQCRTEIEDMTPGRLGYDRLAVVLNRLRHEAAAVAGADHAIWVTRDSRTHERRGYTIYTHDQTTADKIAATIRSYLL